MMSTDFPELVHVKSWKKKPSEGLFSYEFPPEIKFDMNLLFIGIKVNISNIHFYWNSYLIAWIESDFRGGFLG